jgi:hypothetical protein
MMFKFIGSFLIGFIICANALAAEKLNGNIALHIAKMHYEHPVRLLHPYLDVWHMKGPLAEKAALKTLQKRFTNVGNCSATANVVLLIEPHMFYNAQLRVFHAEIIANAYVSTTDLSSQSSITRIKKQAQQNGDLGVKPDFYMEKAYTKAMDKVIKKLETDKAFLDALNKANIENPKLICNALDDMPVSKIYY